MPTPDNAAGSMSEERVREIALGIFREEIFTSMQVADGDMHLLSMIFLPLALMSPEAKQELMERETAMFYAPMNMAAQRSINGYPMFWVMGTVSKQDAARIMAKVKEIESAVGGVP